MAGGKFSEANLFGITLRESANDGSDFTNPDADYRRVFLGEDGELHKRDSAGAITSFAGSGIAATIGDAKGDLITFSAADTPARFPAGANGTFPQYQSGETSGLLAVAGNLLKDFAFTNRTAGNYTANGTSWADLDNGLDLVLSAVAGDIVEVGANGAWSPTGAVSAYLTAVTVVSAAPVNDVATGAAPDNANAGLQGWIGSASVTSNIAGAVMYALQAGDISGGTVTLRLRVRTATATARAIFGTTANPFHWYAKNLGPAL